MMNLLYIIGAAETRYIGKANGTDGAVVIHTGRPHGPSLDAGGMLYPFTDEKGSILNDICTYVFESSHEIQETETTSQGIKSGSIAL